MVCAHMAMLFSSSPQLAGDTAADQRLTLMIDGSFLLHFICSFTHRVSEGTSSSTLQERVRSIACHSYSFFWTQDRPPDHTEYWVVGPFLLMK